MLFRELPSESTSGSIHRAAGEHATVRARKVHVLEDTSPELFLLEWKSGVHSGRVDGDDFAGGHLAIVLRAHNVEGARLGREYDGAVDTSHHQGTPPARV